MRICLLFLFVLLPKAWSAQQSVLSEDFSAVQFPPPGWSEQRLGPNNNGWQRDAFGQQAWHEDFSGTTTENRLVSPAFSLVGLSQAYLHFSATTNYANYLANHPNSLGDGISSMQISLNGGQSWTTIWTDTSQNSNVPYAPTVSLQSYLGQPDVRLGVYFYGTFAQEWWVDDIIIDDTPVPILSTLTNPSNGHPYFLLGQSNRATAVAMAQSLGGHLVAVADSAENTWLVNQFSNYGGTPRELWLGYSDAAQEGLWAWDSLEAPGYENWLFGQPDNFGNEDFAVMDTFGRWRDEKGDLEFHGVIEISGPKLDYSPLTSGQLATFAVSGLRQDSTVVFLFSFTGPGPIPSPFGPVAVDPGPLATPAFPSLGGAFNFSTVLPAGSSGRTLYSQAIEFFLDGGGELSDAVALPIQ